MARLNKLLLLLIMTALCAYVSSLPLIGLEPHLIITNKLNLASITNAARTSIHPVKRSTCINRLSIDCYPWMKTTTYQYMYWTVIYYDVGCLLLGIFLWSSGVLERLLTGQPLWIRRQRAPRRAVRDPEETGAELQALNTRLRRAGMM
ncbi:hypothetical protein BDV96DRAFT_74689 [Lophiotrema nucula]|uniref:Uncharacterized protein n=1 Tax=Lophiotrema nucula TaxID=690887 RepID=A0A6A5Z8A4_9PLEO|nr:hypothetical protein BDV96DRAFT_74689 [Lophiotrema nucula]